MNNNSRFPFAGCTFEVNYGSTPFDQGMHFFSVCEQLAHRTKNIRRVYFSHYGDAIGYAHTLDTFHSLIWVSERGETSSYGCDIWMVFWWSLALVEAEGFGDLPEEGKGYLECWLERPEVKLTRTIFYKPLAPITHERRLPKKVV
jgi:hypothetical protein